MKNTIELLDTSLRDGSQGEGITFSVRDKLAVVKALDALGVTWIEAGNPGSNPKDAEFFRLAAEIKLEHARLCAFGSTRKKGVRPEDDKQVQSLLDANTEAVTIFGKSSYLHVTQVLMVEPAENLAMIEDTVAFFKQHGRFVIYDAEHFFDGFAENADYALSTLQTALAAGADRIVLCDTNGGAFPDAIERGVKAALSVVSDTSTASAAVVSDTSATPTPAAVVPDTSVMSTPKVVESDTPAVIIGIHAHNDSDLAIANSLAAVKAGCRHIQGTLLGFGERCGNTALGALIPSLELKLGLHCLPSGKLEHISTTCRQIAEIANVSMPDNMPYVGSRAFAHKAGMHADGILKLRSSFEHIDPTLVGNDRRFLMSEIGGRSAIAERARKLDPSLTKEHPVVSALAVRLKTLEAEGWQFEGADGSFELLVRRELGRYQPLFKIIAYRVVTEHPNGEAIACSHAWVKVWVDGQDDIAAAEGPGPVNALDGALRRALKRFYPELEQVRLTDYKVRVIDGRDATAARVRVLIESSDGQHTWSTVGVSADIIDASRAALVDSIEYKLIGDIERRFKAYL
ncbi:MAG: citramalate synthase [Treponema sp.]|jgi:2-isopropylmalate synthase|nr:citramalate synthase [Treponema sp.]